MILVDTSVWVNHLKKKDETLSAFLSEAFVLLHPLVIGELACGNLRNRAQLLRYLHAMPMATAASNEEVMGLVERHRLWGRGVGWIDVQLLASALLSNAPFWTHDERLERAATDIGVKVYQGVL